MEFVIHVDGGRTLTFNDLGDKKFAVKATDNRGDVIADIKISKDDIKRLAKAS